jgi:hypothetical protein
VTQTETVGITDPRIVMLAIQPYSSMGVWGLEAPNRSADHWRAAL